MLYAFEVYALDTDRRELRRGQTVIAVQPQVFDLLEYLIRHRDRVVSKDDMLNAVWGGRIVSESTLTSRINDARTAIGDCGRDQRLIKTIPRKGIRFVGVVREGLRPVEEMATAPAVQETKPVEVTVPPRNRSSLAERRQLTVASCELLLGAGAARMDPEDLREIVQSYHGCVAKTAHRYNGFIANTVGNSVLVYFGYPEAHEHDAECAVRAGLDLNALVRGLKSPVSLQTRIGIATGLVVVGDPANLGGAPDIAGETPNIASRLHSIAAPGTVVVAESTRRLLGALFELQDMGVQNVEGIAEAGHVFKTVRPSSLESRFEAHHSGSLTALVGREEELELLLRRWSRAKANLGQVVLLSGEPGIGKSRLTVALQDSLASEPHTRLRYFCSPLHADSALYPIISQMERAAGLTRDDPPKSRLDKFDALLATTGTSPQDATLLAEMLSLPNDGRYPAVTLDPQQRRVKTLEALIAQLEALSRSRPVLMIFEDVHWIDPSTLEALGRTIDRIRALPVLLIVTYRPEFVAPWIGQPDVMTLTVNRLSQQEVSAMVRRVADKLLPDDLLHNIVERSDGIPLFIEEITKAALEAEGRSAEVLAATPSPAPAVPATLHASLLARLDRIPLAKAIAQIGASVGREFSYELLSLVSDGKHKELEGALDQLVGSGLVHKHGEVPHAQYTFKHALVQDVAYSTLLRGRRQQLHGRIGNALLSHYPELADTQPEVLARHFSEAATPYRAIKYWLQAGRVAAGRNANLETAAHAYKGLSELEQLPAGRDRDAEELELRIVLGPALIATKGYGADETFHNYERARQLIPSARQREFGDMALTGLCVSLYNRAEHRQVLEVARELVGRAKVSQSDLSRSSAHRSAAAALNILGEFQQSRAHGERALASFDFEKHPDMDYRFVHDLGVGAACQLAIPIWHQGEIDRAIELEQRALARARALNHHNTTGYCLYYAGALSALRRRDFQALAAHTSHLREHARAHNLLQWVAWGAALEGLSLAHSGKIADGIAKAREGILLCDRIGNIVMRPVFLACLCEMHTMAGDFANATKSLENAFAVAESTAERWVNAELWRLRGQLAIASAGLDGRIEAIAHFRQAIATAKRQGANTLALRSTVALTRVLADTKQNEQACADLASALALIVGGDDASDMKEAKAVLAELT